MENQFRFILVGIFFWFLVFALIFFYFYNPQTITKDQINIATIDNNLSASLEINTNKKNNKSLPHQGLTDKPKQRLEKSWMLSIVSYFTYKKAEEFVNLLYKDLKQQLDSVINLVEIRKYTNEKGVFFSVVIYGITDYDLVQRLKKFTDSTYGLNTAIYLVN